MSLGSCKKCGGTLCVSSGPVATDLPDGQRTLKMVTHVLCEQCGEQQVDHPLLAEVAAAAQVPPPAPVETLPIDYAPGYGDRIKRLEGQLADALVRLTRLEKPQARPRPA